MFPNNRAGLGMRPPGSFGQGPPLGALAAQQAQGQWGPGFTGPPMGMGMGGPMGMGGSPMGPGVMGAPPMPVQRSVTLFVGSISGGIGDDFLNKLLSACGPIKSFKRLITPANKPQGFGFAEYEDPESALRAMKLLNGVELPALEDGCANKKLLIKADEKTKSFLDAFSSQKKQADTEKETTSSSAIQTLLSEIQSLSNSSSGGTSTSGEKYVIPPHLHDLQEAELPEHQRGLVISEIAQFRERAAKREREKLKEMQGSLVATMGSSASTSSSASATPAHAQAQAPPSGPKMREWGKPQGGFVPGAGTSSASGADGANGSSAAAAAQKGLGSKGPQSYQKPVGFVREGGGDVEMSNGDEMGGGRGGGFAAMGMEKTDEELEMDRREARRRDEESSFRDRERRYEPRERQRITTLERSMARERQQREAEERDRVEMKRRLDEWDDDASDEMFYVDRARWRQLRARRLQNEQATDAKSRQYEEAEAENLRRESEAFLERQMDEMQALAEEQRKAGMLLDDGKVVRLNVSLQPTKDSKDKDGGETSASTPTGTATHTRTGTPSHPSSTFITTSKPPGPVPSKVVFSTEDDEEEELTKKRKAPLVKLDFSVEESPDKTRERLERIRESTPKDREELFRGRVRWDGLSDQMIDRKFEPLVKRLMKKYLGDMEEDDLIMFVVEHLKDHKGAQKLVEGLEPVLEEDATDFVIAVWRQVIFESMAYGDGLLTEKMMVDT